MPFHHEYTRSPTGPCYLFTRVEDGQDPSSVKLQSKLVLGGLACLSQWRLISQDFIPSLPVTESDLCRAC